MTFGRSSHRQKIRLALCAVGLTVLCAASVQAQTPKDDEPKFTVVESKNLAMYTIDFRLTDAIVAADPELIVDQPSGIDIRGPGVLIQLQYAQAFGKAQWATMPFDGGVYLHPASVVLPVSEWVQSGLELPAWIRLLVVAPQ